MDPKNDGRFGAHLRKARLAARLTQTALARAAKIPRLRVVRAETGRYTLDLDEATRVARVLRVPLLRLTSGRLRPGTDLRWLAFELYQLGIRDLEVADAHVPGAFRSREQVVAAALKGDQPEPRVVEALPSILARRKLNVPLTLACADMFDPRVRTRLAWLSDVTLSLSRLSTFPVEVKSETQLLEFTEAAAKPTMADSLGHPQQGRRPRLWEKWKITYAGTLDNFLRRSLEVEEAFQRSETSVESDE
jgi:transcriptional regulator with XRE-family HTH domain